MTNTDKLFCARCGHRRDKHNLVTVYDKGTGCTSKETKAVARGKAPHCGCPSFAKPMGRGE